MAVCGAGGITGPYTRVQYLLSLQGNRLNRVPDAAEAYPGSQTLECKVSHSRPLLRLENYDSPYFSVSACY